MLDIEEANKLLNKVADLLEGMGVGYYLDSGTLLAAHRDKTINYLDHDIDVRILPGQLAEDRMPDLYKSLCEIGFKVIAHNWGRRAELICVTVPGKMMLDLKFAFEGDGLLWVYAWPEAFSPAEPRVHWYPKRFFEPLGEIELLGRKYPCPAPIEEYLEHHYGPEWKLFKKRPEQAEESDLTWDFLKGPPCSMDVKSFMEKRKELQSLAPKTEGEKEKL
jgi:hypothetical protein